MLTELFDSTIAAAGKPQRSAAGWDQIARRGPGTAEEPYGPVPLSRLQR